MMQQRCKCVCSCPMAASSWVWVSPATAHYITHVPNYANAAASTAVAAATAALLHLLFQLQYLLTATYKRMRFFWERAVGGRTFNGGASTAPVLQRKLGKQQRPPPGLREVRLPEGAARSGAGSSTVMNPSSRWAIFFSPGTISEGASVEMVQERTELCGNIAPQSSEPTDSM